MSTIVNSREPKVKGTSLWRNRDYLILLSGLGISGLGSQISLIAFPLLFFALTHSATEAGLMSAVRMLPSLLLTLPAGALVDRWERKRLMIVCDAGRALAMLSIPVALWLGHLGYPQLYLVALIEGTLSVFFTLAESACIPRIVEKEQIPDAMGRSETTFSIANTVGPTLAPILYSLSSMVPFLVDAISYLGSAIALFFIKTNFQEERTQQEKSHIWTDIKEGMVWLWSNPALCFLALHTFGMLTPCYGYVLVIIVLGQQMHLNDLALGLIFGAGGLGSTIGALAIAPLYKRYGLYKVMVGTSWLWALGWLFYAFATNAWILGIGNVIGFIVVPLYLVTQSTYRLSITPDHLQGRVSGVFRLIAFGGPPLGMWVTGILIDWLGPVHAVLILFIPQAILAVAIIFSRSIRSASTTNAVA